MVTIYMQLLNEGVDAWRAVEATPLTNDTYRVADETNEDEEWKFGPGTIVRCEWKTFAGGERRLTVISLAD